jgi:hypothetical protein
MPISHLHDASDGDYVIFRYSLVEQVAHGVHKNHFSAGPSERLIEFFGYEAQIKTLLVWVPRDASEALCKSLGVAVLASRADFRAASNRIPSSISPFNL